jgi:ubiquinone/menaquinone biosynthesis C-methylase UbiE
LACPLNRQKLFPMLNNLVNLADLLDLLRKPKGLLSIAGRLLRGSEKTVKEVWAHEGSPPTNWWDIPAVQSRWNLLISGDRSVDYREYISTKYLFNRQSLSALSIGCGTGEREAAWAQTGRFSRIEGYDLSEARIKEARQGARKKGYDAILNYHIGNVYHLDLPEHSYNAIFGEQSLHHFSPLRDLLLKIRKWLKQDGYFIVNEFVGPSRFQWSDRQIAAVNGILSFLPPRYKTLWESTTAKTELTRPSILRMKLTDPSEAVESSKILPLIRELFDVKEIRGYGGTILHPLLSGIAHNFLGQDSETQRLLQISFDIEDALIASGELQSDYVIAICSKPSDR